MSQLKRQRSGRILTVTLDNPPHNFLTTAMVGELIALVDEAEADDSLSVVVLTGRAHVFISHFDVGEIAARGDDAGQQLSTRGASLVLKLLDALMHIPGMTPRLLRGPLGGVVNLIRMHQLFERMECSSLVFIAAINGRALGGGFELALACDFRLIAQEHGQLGFPELNQGIIPGAGGTQRLTRAVGISRASAMILDSQMIEAQQAADLGLVHASVPAEDLQDTAQSLAVRMARRSRISIAAAKQAIHAAYRPDGGNSERIGFLAAASTPAANSALKHYHERLAGISVEPGYLEAEVASWRAGEAYDLHTQEAS